MSGSKSSANNIDVKQLFPDRDLKKEWESNIGTSDFGPPVHVLPKIQIDVNRLQDFYEKCKKREHSVFEDEVIKYALGNQYSSPEDYWQFIIHKPNELAIQLQKELDEQRDMPWHKHQNELSVKKRIRSLVNLNKDYDPIIDERNYNVLLDRLEETYIAELLGQFESTPVRSRFVKLAPGEEISEHIDYSPKYVLKAHIPVYTHEDAVLGFEGYDDIHLPLGYAFVINTGIKHWAKNNSKKMRVHLIVALDGQQDLTYENGRNHNQN